MSAELNGLAFRSRVFELKVHPAAAIFPMLDTSELAELASDIEANGQVEPIVITADDEILDGRNRYQACLLRKLTPKLQRWEGEPGSELDFVVAKNLRRRHLDTSQRAMVAARIKAYRAPAAEARKGQRTDLRADLRAGCGPFGTTSQQVATELNVSPRAVDNAARVLRVAESAQVPELAAAVDAGTVSVDAAAEVAKLPAEELKEVVAGGPEKIREEAKNQRARAAAARQALHSSESNEHYTPPSIVDRARELLGKIDLDPASCSKANEIVQAAQIYTIEDSGLEHDWEGNVFLNFPGGRNEDNESNAAVWTKYLCDQYASGNTAAAVCVLFRAAPSDKWFHPLWRYPICFPWDRIDFLDQNLEPQKSPTHSSAIVYLGRDFDRFVEIFSPIGQCVLPGKKHSTAVGG